MRSQKMIVILFLLGVIILVFPHIAQNINNMFDKKQSNALRDNVHAMSDENKSKVLDVANAYNQEIEMNEPGTYDPFTESYEGELIEDVTSGTDYFANGFASIEIPKLNIELPIFLGASDENLNNGVGQIEGSSLPVGGLGTHTAIAGHRGGIVRENFRHIDQLVNGDIFIIHVLGESHTYKIYNKTIVLPNQTEILRVDKDKDLASLVTCHPYRVSTHRLIVQGERVD